MNMMKCLPIITHFYLSDNKELTYHPPYVNTEKNTDIART